VTETRIDVSDLKSEGSDVVKELTAFLEEKTDAKVEAGTTEIIVKTEGEEPVSRPYLRVLLRKFLHRKEIKDYYRVIGGRDDALIVKERKRAEDEE
jgi:hypothetical protein